MTTRRVLAIAALTGLLCAPTVAAPATAATGGRADVLTVPAVAVTGGWADALTVPAMAVASGRVHVQAVAMAGGRAAALAASAVVPVSAAGAVVPVLDARARVAISARVEALTARAVAAAEVAHAAVSRATAGSLVAQFRFDGGRATGIADESGLGHTLRLVTGNGGVVRAVPHNRGQALRFPAKCTGKPRTCAHAALQSPSTATLNPGTRNISYGASVLLPRDQTTKGQNVVQKGYSTSTSQWKLQVDGAAGRPSCVLVGAKPGIKIVRSTVSVADGRWHDIECRRRGTALTVLVDGAVRGNRLIAADLSITNNRPLSVGGKGSYADNDQFHGTVDDVWVRVG
ncbi:LamG-like jellyroll fold domain-containing protein [Symbioplanes lichenis]|uniref:LamG-like jellyroll fold domain-containing protein n=1 Tax=Symbioplanes lichenis TaxID=1629072 RepID=UPI00273A3BFF|nr:LamG-like jellyroll fold domain-containing protein [Actinoplanes lichenis]